MTRFGLGGRSEYRLRKSISGLHARWQGSAVHCSRFFVLGPCGTRDVVPDNALDVDPFRLLDHHRSACQVGSQFRQCAADFDCGHRGFVIGSSDQVVWHHIVDDAEPERRHLREDYPLAGNRLVHHHVERRNSVGCNHQEAVIAQVVRIPDFPPVDQTGEIRFEHSFRQLRFPKSQHVRKCGLRGRDRNRNRTGR